MVVYDPFHKFKVRTDECDLPFPTAGHTARANQRRGEAGLFQTKHLLVTIAKYDVCGYDWKHWWL